MADIAGWPHWEIQFDRAGNTDAAARTALLDQIRAAGLTDVLVMSHGWGAGVDHARQLYQQWFGMLPQLLPHGSTARPGTIGVFWPSLLWADNPPPGPGGPGGWRRGRAGRTVQRRRAARCAGARPDRRLPRPGPAADPRRTGRAAQRAVHRPAGAGPVPGADAGAQRHRAETIAAEDAGPPSMLNEDPLTLASRFAAALDEASGQLAGGSAGPGGSAPAADEGGAADLPEGGAAGLAGCHAARYRPGRRRGNRVHHLPPVERGEIGAAGVHLLADEAARRDRRAAGPRPADQRPRQRYTGPARAPDRAQLRGAPRVVLAGRPARRRPPAAAGAFGHAARRSLLAFRVRLCAAVRPRGARRAEGHDATGRWAADRLLLIA